MTIIHIKNGTRSINVECAGLTYLEYWEDADIYRCEYSDWAFGLFAMLALIVLLIPIILTIHCWIKWYHKQEAKRFRPNISRQTSYSSVAPGNVDDCGGNQNPDVVYHHPKKKKAYYPYPAYGTCDEASLPGSTPSLYMPEPIDGKDPSVVGNSQNIPIRRSATTPAHLSHLSSSCPVVTSQLRDFRDTLHQEGRAQKEGELFNSLGNKRKSQDSLLFDNKDFAKSLRSNPVTKSFSASSRSSGTSTVQSILDDFIAEETDQTSPIQPIQNNKNTNFLQNRIILSATPPKNMVTRQDFDDYLADCVVKLPEDQRNGTFLVRNSTTVQNCKVLTLYSKSLENNASLYYFKIYLKEDGRCFLEGTDEAFQSIDGLIAHYRDTRSVLPCLLAECLGRNF